ncbi:MAG: type IX secretion system membrane protein PorP/SprF [Hyphomicrobiales bacterium]
MYCPKRITFILIALIFAGAVKAQQAPHFTQNIFNQVFFNPGAAGMSGAICATGVLRSQWVGFKDDEDNRVSPEDFLTTIDAPIQKIRGGVSAAILQDKIGYRTNSGILLGYSYHKELNSGTLGIGMQINMTSRKDDFAKYDAEGSSDLSGIGDNSTAMLFDVNFGLYYKRPNSYYMGVSVANLLESKSKALNDNGLAFYGDRTFYVTAGYDYMLPNNPEFKIEPYLLVETDAKEFQINIASLVKFKDKFWGGIGYRYQESISFMAGLQIKDIRIGYAYDIGLLDIGSGGSHEIMAGYCFKLNLNKGKRIYRNTRFL